MSEVPLYTPNADIHLTPEGCEPAGADGLVPPEPCSGSDVGSCVRLIDFCITQL